MFSKQSRAGIGFGVLSLCSLWTVQASGAEKAADWPNWRGANRDCIVADDKTHIAIWTNTGPLKIWESPAIPSADEGGLGSVVVAGDRVYLFATPKIVEPLATRTLSKNDLRNKFGWSPVRLPADLCKVVEAARVSPERAVLKQNEVGDWVKTNMVLLVTTDEERKKYGQVVSDRLSRGTNALSLEVLGKLATMADRSFTNQVALEQWFDENQIEAPVRKMVCNAIPTSTARAEDTIYCLNAADGMIVWKRSYPGVVRGWGGCCTPCVADGRVYVLGSDSMLYCLNAKDGADVWTARPSGGERHGSFIIVDGLAIVEDGSLMAFDAAKGTPVWTCPAANANNNTPTPWVKDGKTYLICNSERQVSCVDLAGKVLWSAPGGSSSTAAVNGDSLVIFSGRQLLGYRMSLDKVEPLWRVDVNGDRGASPLISKNHVFLAENGRTLCLNLEDGKILWDGKPDAWEYSSVVWADNKLVLVGHDSLSLVDAGTEKFELLAKIKMPVAECATPAFANGRMYLRLHKAVACFDVSQSAPPDKPVSTPAK
jgi:outer membrane protein assembly factor BamB